jgi:sucrose phosphorylase
MKNAVQLICYVDRFAGSVGDLQQLLSKSFSGVFGGVHLLPFFHPIDGADAGFDPIDHTQVDARLGNWQDVLALSEDVELMADVIVNHVSAQSPQFLDFLAQGERSRFAGMFLTRERVFTEGTSEQALRQIYRPRPSSPFTAITLADGSQRILWTTFTADQIDLDVTHPESKRYLDSILKTLAANGVKLIRLDAVGYAIKRAGTSCFMTADTFAFIRDFSARANALGLEVLVEVHSHYRLQQQIAREVDWVYDFALPPLLLHAFFNGTARYLKQWLHIRPTNALTVLDTHDGIGVIDIGADGKDSDAAAGLVPNADLDRLVEQIHGKSKGESRRATGAAASNLDLYQINCTFYDALGRDDLHYLLCRAIQFFIPGIPQVYYVGLLAGSNDLALLALTQVGRDINRHYYTHAEIKAALTRPVVMDLLALIRVRNTHPAFQGVFAQQQTSNTTLDLRWTHGEDFALLQVDLSTGAHKLQFSPVAASPDFQILCQPL